jgi:hypothetical protein
MEVSCKLNIPYALPKGKLASYPLNRRLSGTYTAGLEFLKKRKISCLSQEMNYDFLVVQPFA